MQFIAIDGEGLNNEGRHIYALIANSLGRSLWRSNGLSTLASLEFILETKVENPKATLVGFGLGYDVNMILRDVDRETLKALWNEGEVRWTAPNGPSFHFEWIPGKYFRVRYSRFSAKVYDVFGFFQQSFVHALEDYEIGATYLDFVRAQKDRRSDFAKEDKDSLRKYCIIECKLLVEMMQKLTAALDDTGLTPAQWYGPGAIAAKLLGEKIAVHHVHDAEFPAATQDAIMGAYFGGRVEMFLQGELTNVSAYDIRSAYPRATLDLPSLPGGKWTYRNRYLPAHRFAIWKCGWNLADDSLIMPFPVRQKRSIYYPLQGSGWYHAVEVRSALRHYPLEIMGGWVFEPRDNLKPFTFVRGLYGARQFAKRRGEATEKAYKLALNSLYGKLAQGQGFKGNTPRYQSFYWAGFITAWTRAKILDMMAENPKQVVFCATDAVAFSGDPGIATSDNLGGLDRSHYPELFVAQPGIYHGRDDNGNELSRSRGFFLRDLDFGAMREAWEADGRFGKYSHMSRRFIGLGTALHRTDFGIWRSWRDEEREMKFWSERKGYAESEGPIKRVERLYPPTFEPGFMSEPYEPKRGHLDKGNEDAEYIAGLEQPDVLG